MIHNRRIPKGVHRFCNVVVGFLVMTTACVYITTRWIPAKFQMAGLIVSSVLILGVTIVLAVVDLKRFSIVEGIAGDMGQDELEDDRRISTPE